MVELCVDRSLTVGYSYVNYKGYTTFSMANVVLTEFFTMNGRQGTNQVLYNEQPTRYYKPDKNSSIQKLAGWTLTRYWLAYKVLVGYNNINYKGYCVYTVVSEFYTTNSLRRILDHIFIV